MSPPTREKRRTIVRLRVEWEPEVEDHPQAWDWPFMLGCEAEVLDTYDEDEASPS